MKLSSIAIAALLLPLLVLPAAAQTNLIGIETDPLANLNEELVVSINPTTGQATNLVDISSIVHGGLNQQGITGASYDPVTNTVSILYGKNGAGAQLNVLTINATTGAIVSNVPSTLSPLASGSGSTFDFVGDNPGNFANISATGTATLNSASVTNGLTVGGGVQTTTLNATTSVTTPTITATTANIQTLNVGTAISIAPGSTIGMGGNTIQNVGTPVNPTDAANKQYVDSSIATVNSGLNEAFKKIDQNTQGIAIAMAMGGMAMPSDKNIAFGGNVGFYGGKQAAAFQAMFRINQNVTLNGGVGLGFQDSSQVGGRVGFQVDF